MNVKGLVWAGTRTDRFDEMARFVRDVLDLEPRIDVADFLVADMPNGDTIEVFGPSDTKHTHFEHPVIGFLVDDVSDSRKEMEAHGVTFIGPVHWSDHGASWAHFHAPDGNVYEITSPGR